MLIIDHTSRNVLLLIAGLRPRPWVAYPNRVITSPSGGQIPVVSGMIGDVSSTARRKLQVASGITATNTPGCALLKIPGVCGEFVVDLSRASDICI